MVTFYHEWLLVIGDKQRLNSGGVMAFSNPPGTLLKSYIRSLRFQDVSRIKQSYVDRNAGTLQDGYTPEELVKVSMYYFNLATENCMRDRTVFLMQHMMLLGGESTRRMNLTDLFTLGLKDECCYSEYPALVLIIREGKTNHTSKLGYAAIIRHRDYKLCAFGALAIYFFYRWQVMNEPFPDFKQDESWFDIKVLKGNKGLFEEMDYKTQYNSICKAFDICGINSIKKTHAGRGCGARHAEIAGASEDQLRRHGRWNAQSMENNYLTSLPRQSIRVINSFPGAGGQFWLPRSSVCPPDSLQKKVFPMVDQIFQNVETGFVHGENDTSSTSSYPRTICGQGFLLLLKKLRVIFLQDIVFFKTENPQHPLLQNSLFRDPEFLAFEECLLTTCRDQESPQEMKLKDVVPELEHVLTTLNAKMDTVATKVTNSNTRLQQQQPQHSGNSRELVAINSTLENISIGFNQLKAACSYFANGISPSANNVESSLSVPGSPLNQLISQIPSLPIATSDLSSSPSVIPSYKMQRWVKTVPDLWHEFTVGFTGSMSINELNNKYKSSWRKEESERKMYSRRIAIVNKGKKDSEDTGIDVLDAVKLLEERRVSEKFSLSKLNEVLISEE